MKFVLILGLTLITVGIFNTFYEIAYEVEEVEYKEVVKPKVHKKEVKKKEIDVSQLSVSEKKALFIENVYPAVKKVYIELDQLHKELQIMVEKDPINPKIQQLQQKYKVKNNEGLLKAVKPHPISIALAQAAMESAWGTSRFYLEAKNIFGVWSFNKHEPRIAAGETRGKNTIYVRKYSNYEDSVRGYYLTLGRSHAFNSFRELKMKSDDPYLLVEKLNKYSERGAEYGKELKDMISYNNFTQFDIKQNKEITNEKNN